MVDYKELIERYGDAIHEDPENYLDELHSALQDVIYERDRLREALEDFVRASSRITARVLLRYAAEDGIAKAVGQFSRLYNAQVNAELLLRKSLQEAGDD